MSERERLTELLADCYDDPDLFNSAILKRPPYWSGQRRIADSVVRYRDTAAYTGNDLGKDYLVGGLIPWWGLTRKNSLVIVTGPSQTLLGSVTWKEVRRAIKGCPLPLKAKLSYGLKASPQFLTFDNGWGALGFSTTSVERASGQHEGNLLVIVEEASAVEPEAWEAIDSLNYTILLAIGNPLRAEGRFVDLIRQAKKDHDAGIPHDEAANAIRISSWESPDAHLKKSPRGLASKTFLEANVRKYGRDSLWVRCHLDAIIPEVSHDTLIPVVWLDRAASIPHPPISPFGQVNATRRIAVDLGEGVGRDATCILVRDDLGILEIEAGNSLSLSAAAKRVKELAGKYHIPHNRISYDSAGIGRDFKRYLAAEGIRDAIPYAGCGRAQNPREHYNLRTQAAWTVRRRLNPDWTTDPRFPLSAQQPPFSIPPGPHWPLLREELEKLTYDLVGNQTRLLSKEDHCATLGRSPDRCDALMQSFAFAA